MRKEIEKLDEEWIKETGCEESEDFVIAAFKGETPEVIKRLHHRDHQILELVKGEIEKGRQKYLQLSGLGDHIFREIISVIDKIKEADNNPEQGKGEK